MRGFATGKGKPLGKGLISPPGSVVDDELSVLISGYKRTVASRYTSVIESEIAEKIPAGPLLISPKVDGQLWFLVMEASDAVLISATGRVISGEIPLLEEARAFATRAQGRTVLAGELFGLRKGDRPRVGDVSCVLGDGVDAAVATLGYLAFDLVVGGDTSSPEASLDYAERLETIGRLLDGGKRTKAMKTEPAQSPADVQSSFDALVHSGKAEGLVVRTTDGRIFKVKPSLSLDAAIIGYTQRTEDPNQVRSVLLALMRPDGCFQHIGALGNLGTDEFRASLLETLSAVDSPSTWSHASGNGVLYRFVKPEVVIEITVSDLQSHDSEEKPIQRMVLEYDGTWRAVRQMQGVSIIHPVFERIRDDKEVNETDIRTAQIEERVYIADLHQKSERIELPASTLLRREAYSKETKGQMAVRKLLIWKTEKEELDPHYPAYVVHWTDYSPGRSDPIKKTVRPAADEASAMAIGNKLVEKNIKRGWNPA